MRSAAGPLLALFTVAVALIGAEIAVRLFFAERTRAAVWPCVYEPDERFGFRYRPGAVERLPGAYQIKINRLGFHDREPLPDGVAGLRVLAVGDSFTAGLHVPRAQTWPQALEGILRARGHSADVINVGLDGTGTDVHLDLLRAYLPEIRPHVVVLAFFANDVPDVLNGRFTRECYRDAILSYQSPAQRDALRGNVDRHRERHLALLAFEYSHLVRLAIRAIEGPRSPFVMRFRQPSAAALGVDDELRRARAPQVGQAWRGLERLARDCGCRLVVVPVPPRGDLRGSWRAFRSAAGATSLEAIDVVPALRAALDAEHRPVSSLHFAVDAHLNAHGNRLFARAIADAIDWDAAREGSDSP